MPCTIFRFEVILVQLNLYFYENGSFHKLQFFYFRKEILKIHLDYRNSKNRFLTHSVKKPNTQYTNTVSKIEWLFMTVSIGLQVGGQMKFNKKNISFNFSRYTKAVKNSQFTIEKPDRMVTNHFLQFLWI